MKLLVQSLLFLSITIFSMDSFSGSDSDGVPDDTDNCPNVANSDQLDTDSDGSGDVCDDDDDGDGVLDPNDAFSLISLGDLTDTDSDGRPNDCDSDCQALGMTADRDDDGDGVLDSLDAFPLIFVSAESDLDRDGKPFECDVFCEYNTGMTQDEDDGPDTEDAAVELLDGSEIAGRVDGNDDEDHFFIEVDQPTFITLDLVCNQGYTVEANMKLANNLGFGGGNAYCYQSSWWAEPGRHFLRLEYQQGEPIQDYQLKVTLGGTRV